MNDKVTPPHIAPTPRRRGLSQDMGRIREAIEHGDPVIINARLSINEPIQLGKHGYANDCFITYRSRELSGPELAEVQRFGLDREDA
ncbi:MAG: hypothetical protein ABWY57_15905 [Mycetocola sp.]